MKLKILELASFEIENAKEYYNLQQNSLGDSFKNDVQIAIKNIAQNPKLYTKIESNLRRCILHRFPYTIYYSIDNDTVIILSVAHQRRKPFYTI